MANPPFLNKIPWPTNPIEDYKTIDSGPWGYMYFFGDGIPPKFDDSERPSDHEIAERWGYRLFVVE